MLYDFPAGFHTGRINLNVAHSSELELKIRPVCSISFYVIQYYDAGDFSLRYRLKKILNMKEREIA